MIPIARAFRLNVLNSMRIIIPLGLMLATMHA